MVAPNAGLSKNGYKVFINDERYYNISNAIYQHNDSYDYLEFISINHGFRSYDKRKSAPYSSKAFPHL